MDKAMLLTIAAEFRARAAKAGRTERDDLLFLAAEYEKMAVLGDTPDEPDGFSVVIPN